jgi:hypothetical protein
MRLAVDGAEHSELLVAVLPLFRSNLPCYRHIPETHQNAIDHFELRNFHSLFRAEIGFLSLVLDTQRDLSDEAYRACMEVLKMLLDLFESLLDDQTVVSLSDPIVGGNKDRTVNIVGSSYFHGVIYISFRYICEYSYDIG